MASSDPIDFATSANYVLNHVGHPGQWLPPGGFYERLLDAAFHADPDNLTRIGQGFPMLAAAVRSYRVNGPEELERAIR